MLLTVEISHESLIYPENGKKMFSGDGSLSLSLRHTHTHQEKLFLLKRIIHFLKIINELIGNII